MFSIPQPHTHLLVLSATALLLGACVKQPVEKWPRPVEEIIASKEIELPEALTAKLSPAGRDLLSRYIRTADISERQRLLQELIQKPGSENTSTAIAILALEKNKALKFTIINELPRMEGAFPEKYEALIAVIVAPPSLYLRDAALDAVELLDDPGSLPLWKSLLTDDDPKLRERAARVIASLAPPM